MSDGPTPATLRVSAHVLIQLGSELVTDAEQAILETVKNAYDADSPGCRIDIDTRVTGERSERGPASKLLPYTVDSETVKVGIYDSTGEPCDLEAETADMLRGDQEVERRLSYTGRITIEDTGDGLSPQQLRDSWLVVSRSSKRSGGNGPKNKTRRGRTPLGDKGLGRLGSMKLGDILLVETAQSATAPLASAQFRWKDCEVAATVDEVPVALEEKPNTERFKGTRVSVLGLRDIPDWRRKDRGLEIARSLARLISPFEAVSTFPVVITLDGTPGSLTSVTDEVLRRAIAQFDFEWHVDPVTHRQVLTAHARFHRRLFTRIQSDKQRRVYDVVFGEDEGRGFTESLRSAPRLRKYESQKIDAGGPYFMEMTKTVGWTEMMIEDRAEIVDPGPFTGAFHYFHLDDLDGPDAAAAAGLGIDRTLIKSMAGISILRDGFRVRSQGDWLDLSSGMTSGSTYHMRVNNTIGYFALTGEHNHRLVEKSDREGFVEDAAFRGFMRVAAACKVFANEALENTRRSMDAYYKARVAQLGDQAPRTAEGSMVAIERSLDAVADAKSATDAVAGALRLGIEALEANSGSASERAQARDDAVAHVRQAVESLAVAQSKLVSKPQTRSIFGWLRSEIDTNREQAAALLEGAAVGLSARGLAHELRTHLGEIRHQAATLQKGAKRGLSEAEALPCLRSIRSSCTAIGNAAALIDPMLPRSRTLRETFALGDFMRGYVDNRKMNFDRAGVEVTVTVAPGALTVRANRGRLLQVIDNLVQNSIYWLGRGRTTGEVARPKVIEIEVGGPGFAVSDTGPGVDSGHEESLFEIFVSNKPDRDGGQGLGLFIVKQLLQAEGCDVALARERNAEGRRFRFLVDLQRIAAQVPEHA